MVGTVSPPLSLTGLNPPPASPGSGKQNWKINCGDHFELLHTQSYSYLTLKKYLPIFYTEKFPRDPKLPLADNT